MLLESIVHFTLGIKDHSIIATRFTHDEFRIELDAKKRRKLACSVCGKRVHVEDKLNQRLAPRIPLGHFSVSLLRSSKG